MVDSYHRITQEEVSVQDRVTIYIGSFDVTFEKHPNAENAVRVTMGDGVEKVATWFMTQDQVRRLGHMCDLIGYA
jgi:hypothetical protein